MDTYKGSTIVFVREYVQLSKLEYESKLLEMLSPEEKQMYLSALPVSWEDPVVASGIMLKAATLLFSYDPNPCFRIGFIQAETQFRGLYKTLLGMATVPFIVKQSALFWKTYHKKGEARTEWVSGEKRGIFSVMGYPELPEILRKNISGFIAGTVTLTRVEDVQVHEDFANPHHWKWIVSWK
jgi:hypothetical protein